MKRHADIGAELLSSIPFPYPVTPIVRHHHENWNGSGYPSGISGTDIPLGARILSVVDCFDALTSDRPYRSRLTAGDAFAILTERRGTMYDPLVVDTFIAEFEHIAPLADVAGRQARSLIPIRIQATPIEGRDQDKPLTLPTTAPTERARRAFEKTTTREQAFNTLAQFTARAVPARAVAVYRYVMESEVVRCAHAIGDSHRALLGLEIPKGERTTGWVATTRTGILNSPAALDLADGCRHLSPHLQAAMSVPLEVFGELIGVLTVYSSMPNPFTESHLRSVQHLCTLFAERWSMLGDRPSLTVGPDVFTLPSASWLAAAGRT
jgi:GAF domain-containing protein